MAPEPNVAAPPAAGQDSVGIVGQRCRGRLKSAQLCARRRILHVPHEGTSSTAPRGERLAIGRESQIGCLIVHPQHGDLAVRNRVPELDRPVTRDGEQRPLRTEAHQPCVILVDRWQGRGYGAGVCQVPDFDHNAAVSGSRRRECVVRSENERGQRCLCIDLILIPLLRPTFVSEVERTTVGR